MEVKIRLSPLMTDLQLAVMNAIVSYLITSELVLPNEEENQEHTPTLQGERLANGSFQEEGF